MSLFCIKCGVLLFCIECDVLLFCIECYCSVNRTGGIGRCRGGRVVEVAGGEEGVPPKTKTKGAEGGKN